MKLGICISASRTLPSIERSTNIDSIQHKVGLTRVLTFSLWYAVYLCVFSMLLPQLLAPFYRLCSMPCWAFWDQAQANL